MYDHRKPVDKTLDGTNTALLELRYLIPNFEGILEACFESLATIWPNQYNILKFWCIKHAENPSKSREVDESKDSYDRRDNYDAQGIAIFAYLNFKPQIDQIFGGPQQTNVANDGFMNYQKYQFFLEACLPSINFMIQQSISHANSETLKQIGLELSTFLIFMSE